VRRQSFGVDRGSRVFVVELSNLGNGVSLDTDVRPAQRTTGPVRKTATADDHI
jgi:hypothetical protein